MNLIVHKKDMCKATASVNKTLKWMFQLDQE